MPVLVPGSGLCSVAEAKLQIDKSSTFTGDDGELQDYINAITAPVEDFVGAVLPRTVTEWHRCTGDTLILREENVISVTSISEFVGTTSYAYTPATDPSSATTYSYLLDTTQPGTVRRLTTGGRAAWFGGELQVTYVAGMATVPPSINLAARLLVADLWITQQGGADAALPPVFQEDTVTLDSGELPSGRRVYELLSRYQRVQGIA